MIIAICRESTDYDILLDYLLNNSMISEISITSNGVLARVQCETRLERRKMVSTVLNLDVEIIELLDILYEEFKPSSRDKDEW